MKIRTLHETDLFHPHQDPDDHWDLACQFALAARGDITLTGVLIDHPPEFVKGDPDIMAVAQLNAVTGLHVPVGVGEPTSGGVQMLLEALQAEDAPLTLHIVGSSRDVAEAIRLSPDLFERNCRAIYLNAGSGMQNERLEYNVELDVQSYSAIFDAPCPVYWMPCFHRVPDWSCEDMQVGQYGTFYRFRQREILNVLSPRMQNYFLYMLSRSEDVRWLRALEQPVDALTLRAFGDMERNMWCTGGFLHAAGYSVDRAGQVVPLSESPNAQVFDFTPVQVRCVTNGKTEWTSCAPDQARQFLFTVRDEEKYAAAMTQAMKWLLTQLP